MHVRFALLFIVMISALVASPRLSDAQADKPKCDPATVIKKANELKASGDAKKDIEALTALTSDISAANIACNGFSWNGKGSKVYDPFDLPKGSYRMKLDWKGGPLLATVEHIGETTCAGSVDNTTIENRFNASEDCRATLQVKIYSDNDKATDWTITLEPLK